MKLSDLGLAIMQLFENYKDVAYPDQGGVWTLGFGHTEGVKEGDACTLDQATEWLATDVGTAEAAVTQLVKVPLGQYQFDALVSFSYNVGETNFERSTLLLLLNGGQSGAAADEFLKWDHIAGVDNIGLLRRRKVERALFLSQ